MRPPTRSRVARQLAGAVAASLAILAGCGGSGTTTDTDAGGPVAVAGAKPSKPVTITVWHSNVDEAQKKMEALAAQFTKENPDITVKAVQGAPADDMLTKLSTVLGTDSYPDIAYVFGTDAPSLARSTKTVDLTAVAQDPAFGWDDFYAAEREVATVNGKVVGVPALVDNLAVVYNKKLFRAAGLPEPSKDWTWDDFAATAKKLTNPTTKVFGTGYPVAGDEDTVWRFWPMIWQQGGIAISADAKSAPFDTPPYAKALGLLKQMAVDDKSMYTDPNSDAIYSLFANDKIGMVVTGPFALADFDVAKVDYGVVQMPAFGTDHQTVSGPDNWMVFDNGPDRIAASAAFLTWLTQPAQDAVWSVSLANMPVRGATQATPAWKKVAATNPAFQAFADNFANTKQKRPQTTAYPAYSAALGEQIASVLTGQTSVEEGLAAAKSAADAALADEG